MHTCIMEDFKAEAEIIEVATKEELGFRGDKGAGSWAGDAALLENGKEPRKLVTAGIQFQH